MPTRLLGHDLHIRVGCDPEAIGSTLAWGGDQFDDTIWESAHTEYATS